MLGKASPIMTFPAKRNYVKMMFFGVSFVVMIILSGVWAIDALLCCNRGKLSSFYSAAHCRMCEMLFLVSSVVSSAGLLASNRVIGTSLLFLAFCGLAISAFGLFPLFRGIIPTLRFFPGGGSLISFSRSFSFFGFAICSFVCVDTFSAPRLMPIRSCFCFIVRGPRSPAVTVRACFPVHDASKQKRSPAKLLCCHAKEARDRERPSIRAFSFA